MTWTNAVCCERCWLVREGTWEPSPTDPSRARLIDVREPVRVSDFELVECQFCNWPTFSGIYVRVQSTRPL